MLSGAHEPIESRMVPLTSAEIDCVTGGLVLVFVEKYDKFGEAYMCPVWVNEVEAAMMGGNT